MSFLTDLLKWGAVRSVTDAVTGRMTLRASDGRVYAIGDPRGGSRMKAGKPLFRLPASTTGMVMAANATVTQTTRHGLPCLEITGAAETFTRYLTIPIENRVYTDKIHFVFEVEDAAEWNGGRWRFGVYTSDTHTQGMYADVGGSTVGTTAGWSGFHLFAPKALDWVAQGAGSFSDTMTHLAFACGRKAGPVGTAKIWLYEAVEVEKQTLPSIIIGADDGHITWFNSGLPVLEKYGFSSYLAYIHDNAIGGSANYMTVANWQAAIARGHHAVVHGPISSKTTLRDYFASYAPYASPQAAMQADIAIHRNGMVDNGLDPDTRGRNFYVYPGGFHQPSGGAGDDTIVDAAIAEGMTAARIAQTDTGIVVNGGMRSAQMYIPIIGHSYAGGSEAANITAITTLMSDEIGAGRSVVLMFHQIDAAPSIAEQITVANLETIVAAANVLVTAGSARRGKLTDLADELSTYAPIVHLGA